MQGPIWLGLTHRAVSLRPYEGLSDIGRMVSRSAYAQLDYSPLLLAGTVVGMVITYLVPALLALFGSGTAQAAGLAAWLLMARLVPAHAALLSLVAAVGRRPAGDRRRLYGLHRAVGDRGVARPWRHVEGTRPGEMGAP